MPPPAPLTPGAVLPLMVLLVMFTGPLWTLKMPAPEPLLPLSVLLVTLMAPVSLLKMPPPESAAVLLLSVLLLTLTVPVLKLRMPPPEIEAVLLLIVLLMRLTVAVLLLRMPPPELPPVTVPFAIVKPEKVATPGFAKVRLKTRLLLLPLIVNRLAPGPWKVRLLSIANSPEVSVMGLVTWVMSKVIVLPGQALAMIPRSEPAPLSLLLVTMVGAQLTEMVKLCGPEVSTPPLATPPLSWRVIVIMAAPLTLVVGV